MRHLFSLLLSGMLLLLLSACEMRGTVDRLPNTGPEVPEGDYTLIIDVDWSEMDEDPTGMTLLFYPSDGSLPYMRSTNSIYHYVITLPEDDYKIIIFNQSETEFSYLNFIGLEQFESATVEVAIESDERSRIDRLFDLPSQNTQSRHTQGRNTRAKSNAVRVLPREFGSAAASVTTNKPGVQITRAKSNAVRVLPRPSVGQMNINVRVAGLTRNPSNAAAVCAVNGALSGISTGMLLGSNALLPTSMIQEIDEWTINYCDAEDGVGSISTSFGTFGISPSVDYSRADTDSRASEEENGRAPSDLTYVEDSPEDDTRNILYLNFRLTDGSYVPYRFDVTHRIIETDEIDGVIVVSVVLELDLGVGVDGVDDGLDEPLILPAHGIPYSSGGISVQDWGETIFTEVPLE